MRNETLQDVLDWARVSDQPREAVRELARVPTRLGMLISDMGHLPADLEFFERIVVPSDYGTVSKSAQLDRAARRGNARVRALLRRFHARSGHACEERDIRAAWKCFAAIVRDNSGIPRSGKLWGVYAHYSLSPLATYARVLPSDLDQAEVDYVSSQVPCKTRDVLRRAVRLMNDLQHVREVPELKNYLPRSELSTPQTHQRARRIRWSSLPPAFRSSFDAAVHTYCHGDDEFGEALIARIEAGGDPDEIMAEAEAGLARLRGAAVTDPMAAAERFRAVLRWLVRTHEDAAGDVAALTDVREIMTSEVVRAAIRDHTARAKESCHIKNPLSSNTLHTRLRALIAFARYGLRDQAIATVIDLLRHQYDHAPKRRRHALGHDDMAVADEIARKLQRSPQMGVAFAHGPQRVARVAERRLSEAQQSDGKRAEKSALLLTMAAVMLAIQLSRPQRTSNLANLRIRSTETAVANLVSAPNDTFRFELAAWEVKSRKPISFSVVGEDAEILRRWLDDHRLRLLALYEIEDSVYLFPGRATPRKRNPDGQRLPCGRKAVDRFYGTWSAGTRVLGYSLTPHKMRHLVALLILAARPGDYAFAASVLGITEATARQYYGRDTGELAAQQCRAAILAAHPDAMAALKARTHR